MCKADAPLLARCLPPTVHAALRCAVQLELSLDDLKRNFRKHTVAAAMQCTGNRRQQLNEGESGPPALPAAMLCPRRRRQTSGAGGLLCL